MLPAETMEARSVECPGRQSHLGNTSLADRFIKHAVHCLERGVPNPGTVFTASQLLRYAPACRVMRGLLGSLRDCVSPIVRVVFELGQT